MAWNAKVVSQEEFEKWLAAREARNNNGYPANRCPRNSRTCGTEGFIRKVGLQSRSQIIVFKYYFLALTAVFAACFFLC